MSEPALEGFALTRRFGGFVALDGVNIALKRGEIRGLIGPNGAGKSTLIDVLTGRAKNRRGRVVLNGEDVSELSPQQRRKRGMARSFQRTNIFPELTVEQQLRVASWAVADADIAEVMNELNLTTLAGRPAGDISYGDQRRLDLALALVGRPQVLLLDEPLAALDKKLRESTQLELMELQRRLGMTFIIVTHDQEEAMTVANRIGVMDAGRLEQVATPRELYEAPASRWIAGFVGEVNLFEGQLSEAQAGPRDSGRLAVATRDAGTIFAVEPRQPVTRTDLCVAIRPEKVKLSRRGPAADAVNASAINRMEGVVTDVGYLGGFTTYKVKLDSGATLRCSVANTARLDVDAYGASQRVVAWFTPDDCVVLER